MQTQFMRVIDVVGDEAAKKIIKAYSGTTLRIPSERNIASHPITLLIGEKLVRKIFNEIGNSFFIYIPKVKANNIHERDKAIVLAYLNGEPVEKLALKHAMSDRNVWRILKKTQMNKDC